MWYKFRVGRGSNQDGLRKGRISLTAIEDKQLGKKSGDARMEG
jgi:hypothetical protein